MSKKCFRVGDRVKVLYPLYSDERNTDMKIGETGLITKQHELDIGYYVKFDRPLKFGDTLNFMYYKPRENTVLMTSSQLEFIEHTNDEKIVIYRDGNQVIALNKATGKKGIRKCNPADTFDFNIGAKLAFERLTANVTFKILRLIDYSPLGRSLITKGKVYECVAGIIRFDNLDYKVDSYKELIRRNPHWRDKVIEIKDGDDPDEILKKHDSTIRVGDTVEIVDSNKTYRLYTEWVVEHIANKSDIRYFCYNRLPFNGLKCKVLHIAKHNSHYENLAYVKSESNQCYVIAVDGLKKV